MVNHVELVIQDANTKQIYNMNEVVEDGIELDSEYNGGANKLVFKYIQEPKEYHVFPSGSTVQFKYKHNKIFFGYIFESSQTQDGAIEVVAYDSLRYLKYKDTKILNGNNNTAEKLVKEIVRERQLRRGIIDPTYFGVAPKLLDNQTYLDMIMDVVDETLVNTGKKYILFDKFGYIHLEEAEKLKLPIVIGNESFLQEYDYTTSIDGDTYNIIRLARDDKETGTREHFQVQDSKNIAKWGMLQYYEKVQNLNDQQMKDKANKLLKLYNREEKKFSFKAFGDSRVFGGHGIYVDIPKLGIKQWFMVSKVSHEFHSNYQLMDVDLIV